MWRRIPRRLIVPVMLRRSTGVSVPYEIDFTELEDGALPDDWTALDTWAIDTGALLCTPVTLGDEMLSDPGLEGTYTSGLNAMLTKNAASSCTEENADVHGGSKAQKCAPTSNAYLYISGGVPGVVSGGFYLISQWAKKVSGAGTTRIYISSGGDNAVNQCQPNISGDWAEYLTARIAVNSIGWQPVHDLASGVDTVIVDDLSCKALAAAEVLALIQSDQSDVNVKAGFTIAEHKYMVGVVARANNTSEPTSYLLGVIYISQTTSTRAILYKVVDGTVTYLESGYITKAAGKLLEIRCNGSTVQLFYNGSQVGSDQTVEDAEILNNKIHGVMSVGGGNSLDSFFLDLP
jgi:hypothetical protein